MPRITKLEVQKNNKNKYNLFLNDEFYAGVFIETVIKLNLKEGKEVSEETLQQALFESEKTLALNKCANLLSKTLKTAKQIKDYLNKKGFSPEVVSAALDKLKEYSYVNDSEYCSLFIKSNLKKMGKQKLKNKLMEKGISKFTIEEKLSELETDPEVVITLANKFVKNKELNDKTKASLIRHLISKGFLYEEIKPVVAEIFKGESYGSWN